MSLGPSLGRFQFLPRPKIVAGSIPRAYQAGEEEAPHPPAWDSGLGPNTAERGGGGVPVGVEESW